jgi:PRC-barrel domain
MPTVDEIRTWQGCDVVGPDDDKIGSIGDIYLDRRSGDPEWVAIKSGLFGTKLHFAPISGADMDGDVIRMQWDKDTIRDAPHVEVDGELTPEEEARLYSHYGRDDHDHWTGEDATASMASGTGAADRDAGDATRESSTGDAPRGAARGRLRRYVIAEETPGGDEPRR